MVRCVQRLQRLPLRDQGLELGLALIDYRGYGQRLGALLIVRLLGNHRLQKGHILLLPVQRLRHCVKLSRQ